MAERTLSIVEESLKTLRAIHRMLMLLCATVFVVALSPYEHKDYSEAIAELDAVTRIDLDQFIKDSYASLNALPQDSKENMDFVEKCHFSIRYEFNKIGQDVLELDSSRWGHSVHIAAFDVEQVERLQSSRVIGDYRQLIVKDLGVDLVWFNPSRVAEAFLDEFKDPHKIPREFLGYPAEASLFMNSPDYCPTGTKNFCGVVSLELIFTEPKLGTFRAEIENPPVWKVEKLTETGFQKWLNRQGLLESIVERYGTLDMPYTKELLFPNLRPFWRLVEDKTPEEAKRVLVEKASEQRREVSLLGVKLDMEMIVTVAPLLTAIIYLFFLSYAAHLKRIYNGAGEILRKFPWLLLFSGVIHSIASIALVLLPSFALVLLVGRYWYIGGWTLILGIVFTISSVILAFCCLRETNYLRKKASASRDKSN